MRVEIEREDGDRLGGEKLRLPSHRYYHRFTRFCARRGHPGDELSAGPPHPDCEFRIVDCGFGVLISNPQFEIHNPQLDCFDDLLGRTVNPLQTLGAHEPPPQLRGLDHRTHAAERREQAGEFSVVMHGIGLARLEGGADSDGLAHRRSRLHSGDPGDRSTPQSRSSGGTFGSWRIEMGPEYIPKIVKAARRAIYLITY